MRLIIAIALLLSVTPGMAEVAEAAVHLVIHGDLAHADHEAQHDDDCSEHTCTPLAHHCGCHATMSAQMSTVSVTASHANVSFSRLPMIESERGRVCGPPPLRPPIV